MKLIETIKKHDNIFILIFILIIVSAVTFNVSIQLGDELWLFSHIYKMANGFLIYRDINVIITPLFFYIGEVLFKLFGANYLIYRIYETLIHVFMWFSIYQLFKALKIRKLNSILYLLGIITVYANNMISTGSYNTLAIALYIIGIILLIKEKFKPSINAILQGIIIFLIFMTKQNVVIYYILANAIYKLVTNKNLKNAIKTLFIELSTSFAFLLIFLFMLYSNNNLYNFINYTVLGMGEFAENNTAIFSAYIAVIQFVLLVAYIIIASIKNIPFEDNIRKNIKMLSIFSIALILFGYPIFNEYHVMVEAVLTIVTTLYILDKLIFETLLNTKLIDTIKKVAIVCILTYFSIICVLNNSNYIQKMYKEGPYLGGVLSDETIEEINEVVAFIQNENSKGYDVKILSSYANLYMNVLNKNNGAMDLIFNGNMGKDGADGIIKQIKESKNTKYLITKEEDKVFQESKKIRDYVQNNLSNIGEVNRFFIYK